MIHNNSTDEQPVQLIIRQQALWINAANIAQEEGDSCARVRVQVGRESAGVGAVAARRGRADDLSVTPASSLINTLPITQIVSYQDRFVCEPMKLNLRVETCLDWQATAREAALRGDTGPCSDCSLGKQVAAQFAPTKPEEAA